MRNYDGGGGMVSHSKCLTCYAYPPPKVAGGGLLSSSSFSRIFLGTDRIYRHLVLLRGSLPQEVVYLELVLV